MGRARGWSLLGAGALLAALCGCTDAEPRPAPPASSSTAEPEATASPEPVWSLDDVRVDRVPADPPLVESALPTTFPADDAALPDLLADPPGRARLTYHPRETFDDVGGWVTERVLFLGTDGAWRSLEMVDLGLPESTHPGVDTYGAGELSPDGTRWAAKTNDGIVLLDLRTARAQVVPLPGKYTNYLDWRPDGRRLDVVRYSPPTIDRTWTVDPRSLAAVRAPYDLPLSGYADDSSVVTYARRDGETVRIVHRDGTATEEVVPLSRDLGRIGGAVGPTRTMFGLRRGLLAMDSVSVSPVARLRLRPREEVASPIDWWDNDTVWFYEGSRGLLTWDVVTGEFGTLTHVRPGARRDSWWTASVAVDLMR
jgi:hypothetical protein